LSHSAFLRRSRRAGSDLGLTHPDGQRSHTGPVRSGRARRSESPMFKAPCRRRRGSCRRARVRGERIGDWRGARHERPRSFVAESRRSIVASRDTSEVSEPGGPGQAAGTGRRRTQMLFGTAGTLSRHGGCFDILTVEMHGCQVGDQKLPGPATGSQTFGFMS
jgi:hypothetical protein